MKKVTKKSVKDLNVKMIQKAQMKKLKGGNAAGFGSWAG